MHAVRAESHAPAGRWQTGRPRQVPWPLSTVGLRQPRAVAATTKWLAALRIGRQHTPNTMEGRLRRVSWCLPEGRNSLREYGHININSAERLYDIF